MNCPQCFNPMIASFSKKEGSYDYLCTNCGLCTEEIEVPEE